jgi:PBSX family phage terminase large subunit
MDRTIRLLPKQYRFVRSSTRELLYSGAFGAGKTRALCYKLAMRASVPGAREAVVRKQLSSLKATTLKTLLEPEGGLPPVLPKGSFAWNKTDRTIKIHGGGEIVYLGFDDPESIGSYNLSGAAVDELVQLSEEDYTWLRGRIRLSIPGLPNQIYGACNPGPPTHWAAARFGLAQGHQAAENCEAISTNALENWYLPKAYVRDLETLQGVARKRYVLGIWAGAEGLVYDMWDREHGIQRRNEDWDRIVFGLDDGYTNPCAIGKWGVDHDGRMHRIQEHYESGMLNRRKAEVLRAMGAAEAEAVIVDPAAAELRAELINAGLPVVEAENDVWDGIQVVQQRLALAGDGRPRLTVDPSCEHWLREIESYEWRKNRDGQKVDEPVKAHDHAMDETRYVAMYLRAGRVLVW